MTVQSHNHFDLDGWIAKHQLDVVKTGPWQDGRRWILRACPWNPLHTRAAYIIQFSNGAVAAGCHHTSCSGKDWHALRDLLEPSWRSAGTFVTEPARELRPSEPADWSDPEKIQAGLLPVPPLSIEMVPPPLRRWLGDIAERTQCPPEFPAVGAIVSMSSVVGNAITIRPKQFDDWAVVSNLWGAIVGPPGILKSPMLNAAMGPLTRLVVEAQKEHEKAMTDHEFNSMVRDAKLKKLKGDIDKLVKDGADVQAMREQMDELEATAPVERRFIVNDPTVEKLGELLNQNPRGLLLFRDELKGWLRSLEKDGRETDRSFYLEAWDGSSPYVYDRIGRGTIRIGSTTLAIAGSIQPGPLTEYLRGAISGGVGDDGLLQRFQLAVYPDIHPDFKLVDRYPDAEAKNEVFRIFQELDKLNPERIGAVICGNGDFPFLRFEPSAQGFFNEWYTELERTLRKSEEHPALIAHLAKFRRLMPSLALLFHLLDVVTGSATGDVSLAAAKLAAEWCDFLFKHAKRIYGLALDSDSILARLLADHIAQGDLPSPFVARDVYRKHWSGLSTPKAVEEPLHLLEELGWVRSVSDPKDGKGRSSVRYYINPKALKVGKK
ncbi:MAG TPA: YfjI family protein [Blastocatellia bacterium]|nr:YfjI family protein [Blastocatellia bacterium]